MEDKEGGGESGIGRVGRTVKYYRTLWLHKNCGMYRRGTTGQYEHHYD